MKTVFNAVGGETDLRELADAWHQLLISDEVVSHAFSHGFRADQIEPLDVPVGLQIPKWSWEDCSIDLPATAV